MALPAALSHVVEWWSGVYGDHRAVSVLIRYLHLAGIVVGGGAALTADRRALGAWRSGRRRDEAIADARRTHRVVVPSLAVVAMTGALMAAADLATFTASRVYWLKMILVALLVVNGGLLVRFESSAGQSENTGAWRGLGTVSAMSLVLWLAVLLVGVWLTVAA